MKKFQVITPTTDVRQRLEDAELETELLMGEIFIMEEDCGEFIKGTCEHDAQPGYIKKETLSEDIYEPTHIIKRPHTHAYKEDNIESEVVMHLSFASQLKVIANTDYMSQISSGEWVMSSHLSKIDEYDNDYVETALQLLNTPYRWGGRSGFGIDCSGLVQVCLSRADINVPRNTGQQCDAIGKAVDSPQKGDIVFFKGHVGIMVDDTNIINAIGFGKGNKHGKIGMNTRIDPLEELADLYEGGIKAIRRLNP